MDSEAVGIDMESDVEPSAADLVAPWVIGVRPLLIMLGEEVDIVDADTDS